MAFKINIGEKGKTFKLELETEDLIGKKIGEKIDGKELKPELAGFELEITGTSDKAGFPGKKDVDGLALKRVLLTKGKFMKGYVKRRKKTIKIKGLRQRKTVRGNQISLDTIQINTRVIKSGSKKLEEIFPEQNKPKAKPEKVKAEPEVKEQIQETKEVTQEAPAKAEKESKKAETKESKIEEKPKTKEEKKEETPTQEVKTEEKK